MAVECPVCFGEGGFDFSASNALFRETLDREALALVTDLDVDWVVCDACYGSGCMDAQDAQDILAVSRAAVDQFMARMRNQENT